MTPADGSGNRHPILAAMLSPAGIALTYALVGTAWILWSDQLTAGLLRDPDQLTRFQTAKGVGYVLVTASLLWLGVRAGQAALRRTGEALAKSEAGSRALLEEASDAIFVVNEAGLVTLANRRAGALLGRPAPELLGQPLGSLLGRIEPGQLAAATATISEHGAFLAEHTVHRPDGSSVTAEFHFARLADGRIQAIARDITERRRLEAQLLQAQRMEVVGRLAGGVAHDFNNLLTIIVASAESARLSAPRDSDLEADLATISATGQRGAELTRQLLTLSRRRAHQPRRIDLTREVEGHLPLMRRLVGTRITIATDLDPEAGDVQVDPGLLEQALLNLVANGRDAMPEGGTLTVRTFAGKGVDGAGRASVAVCDTGHGMDEAVRRQIFEPFFTTKPEGEGTGLGLAMTERFVTQSGGTIEVASAPGAGSTFTLHFPRLAAPSPPLP